MRHQNTSNLRWIEQCLLHTGASLEQVAEVTVPWYFQLVPPRLAVAEITSSGIEST